jgi:hypothetical protein
MGRPAPFPARKPCEAADERSTQWDLRWIIAVTGGWLLSLGAIAYVDVMFGPFCSATGPSDLRRWLSQFFKQ